MAPTFDERRDAIRLLSQKKIAKAYAADRQARDRTRKQVRRTAGFEKLSVEQQTQALEDAEEKLQAQRESKGHDMETKRAEILDEESTLIVQINQEETASLLKSLRGKVDEDKGKKRAHENEDESKEASIKKAFNTRLTPVIEKLERQIIAGGAVVVPGVSQEELAKFAEDASNPADVAKYLEYWNTDGVDLDEGLCKEESEDEDDDDDLEIVISEDEEEDSDDDEGDLEDLIDDSEL